MKSITSLLLAGLVMPLAGAQTSATPAPIDPVAVAAAATAIPVATQAAPEKDVSSMNFGTQGPAPAPVAPAKPAEIKPTPAVPAPQPQTAAELLPSRNFNRVFTWTNATLDEVVSQLNHDFQCPIVLQADPKARISGTFSGETIEAVLKLVCSTANLSYSTRQGMIYLTPAQPQAVSRTTFAEMMAASPKGMLAGTEPEQADHTTVELAAKQPVTPAPKKASASALSRIAQRVTGGFSDKNLADLSQRRIALLAERRKLLLSAP